MKKISGEELKNIQRQSALAEKELRKQIEGNRIQFFGLYNEYLDNKFPDLKLKGPNPLQQKILDAWLDYTIKVFVFTGSNRLGKTTILTILANCVMFGEFPWSGEKIQFPHNEPRKIRYVGQDWEKHIKAVTIPALKKWWPKSRGLEVKKNSQGIEALWTDKKTGSSLEIMSNKQESDLHEGWDGDLILYDEPPKRDIRVANARGLIDRQGREFFAMTLLKEAWVHREVIKARLEDGRPDPTVFAVDGDIYNNVGFGISVEGVDQFKKTLKPDEIQARILGKPAYLAGLIFPKFSRNIHVKKRFPIPLDWIVEIAIDYHPRKPLGITMIATDTLDRKWVFYESNVHGNYKLITEEIIRYCKYHQLRVENILCDPLAKGDPNSDNKEEDTFTKIGDILHPYGYPMTTASKAENSGITMINEILITESNEASFFVFDDCVKTIEQMEGWMWIDGKPARDDEDMCENIYRIVLLDTRYTSPFNNNSSSSSNSNWRTA